MKHFIRNNSLTLVLFGLFFIFLCALSFTGYKYENQELSQHGQPAITYGTYLTSSDFMEAIFENWESEFLQMGALVVLTIFLTQKGSPDSKKIHGKEAFDTKSHYTILHAQSWAKRKKGIVQALYANSLSFALFGLFFLSLILHAFSGTAAANEEATLHHTPPESVMTYARSAQFWFESFQNWQSEFLAVGSLILLSIYLRQRRSPESKAIGEPNSKTGS